MPGGAASSLVTGRRAVADRPGIQLGGGPGCSDAAALTWRALPGIDDAYSQGARRDSRRAADELRGEARRGESGSRQPAALCRPGLGRAGGRRWLWSSGCRSVWGRGRGRREVEGVSWTRDRQAGVDGFRMAVGVSPSVSRPASTVGRRLPSHAWGAPSRSDWAAGTACALPASLIGLARPVPLRRPCTAQPLIDDNRHVAFCRRQTSLDNWTRRQSTPGRLCTTMLGALRSRAHAAAGPSSQGPKLPVSASPPSALLTSGGLHHCPILRRQQSHTARTRKREGETAKETALHIATLTGSISTAQARRIYP